MSKLDNFQKISIFTGLCALIARSAHGIKSDDLTLFFGDTRHPSGPISEEISLLQILPTFSAKIP